MADHRDDSPLGIAPSIIGVPRFDVCHDSGPIDIVDRRIGIAISGGGHRATLYSLGGLAYLADAGLNKSVVAIASVSGGSITNGYLALLEHSCGKPYNKMTGAEFAAAANRLLTCVAGAPTVW